MKDIEFEFHKKKYKFKVEGLIGIAVCCAVIIAAVVYTKDHFTDRSQQIEEEAVVDLDQDYDASKGKIDAAQYDGTVLRSSEDAGKEYIDSTLFLGDSNTARFMTVPDEDGETFTTKNNTIGVVGMGIDAISSLPCMQFSTGLVTMPNAVKILQPERVIITFGTNNLSGNSTDATSFIERYTRQIQAISDAYPSVDIIVNAIPPVAKNRSYTNVTMTQIDAYNKAIAKMCEDNEWKFLDSSETLKDEDTGYAQEGYTISDGLHLSQSGLEALFAYIREHSWITKDDRPQPLNDIPEIIGVPDHLIKTDPLTDEVYTVDPATEGIEATPSAEVTESPEASAASTPSQQVTVPANTPTATPTSTPDCQNGGRWNSQINACDCTSAEGFSSDPNNNGLCTYKNHAETTAPAESAAASSTAASTESTAPADSSAAAESTAPSSQDSTEKESTSSSTESTEPAELNTENSQEQVTSEDN